jgi:hypothetical protein
LKRLFAKGTVQVDTPATGHGILALLMLVVCALFRTPAMAAIALAHDEAAMESSRAAGSLSRLPLHFEPADNGFVARAIGTAYRIAPDRISGAPDPSGHGSAPFTLRFEGANARTAFTGDEPLAGRSNYFLAGHARRDVPHYAKLRAKGLYRGIDVLYHGRGRDLEYDLLVAPYADPGQIRLRFDNVAATKIDPAGDLIVQSGGRTLIHQRPRIFQDIAGRRVDIDGRYVSLGRHRFALRIGRYDRGHPLTIDPVLSYSTALAGKALDAATAIAVDGAGNAYVAGWTTSSNFPTLNGYDNRVGNNDRDVFVTKLNATGTGILYSTYIGGSKGLDFATGIAVDALGSAYVTGTAGTDFPVTTGAYRTTPGAESAAFVAKLAPAGNTLSYSTFLPFAANTRVAVDAGGNAYVAGQASIGFVTKPGALQTTIRTVEGGAPFALKLNAGGTDAIYSTIVGGTGVDVFRAMALDAAGNLFIGGATSSPDFPLANPLQSSPQGGVDGFVAKLNASASGLIYSTYLGGVLDDSVNAIAVDAAGNAYVAGETYSSNFPVRNPFQPTKAGFHLVNSSLGNAFVAKLATAGDALVYSSFLGGEVCFPYYCQSIFGVPQIPGDAAYGIAVDGAGHAIVTGIARSYTFPRVDSRLGAKQDDSDRSLFVTKLTINGTALLYSSLIYTGFDGSFGGQSVTGEPYGAGHAIAVDGAGNAYLALQDEGDFPTTPGAFQTTTIGGHSFVFKLSNGLATVALSTSANPSLAGDALTINATVSGVSGGDVAFFDGPSQIGSAPVIGGAAALLVNGYAGIRRLTGIYRDGAVEADSPVLYQVINPRAVCP